MFRHQPQGVQVPQDCHRERPEITTAGLKLSNSKTNVTAVAAINAPSRKMPLPHLHGSRGFGWCRRVTLAVPLRGVPLQLNRSNTGTRLLELRGEKCNRTTSKASRIMEPTPTFLSSTELAVGICQGQQYPPLSNAAILVAACHATPGYLRLRYLQAPA